MTVEDEDTQQDVEEDPERLASVAHYIMMHYAEKESVKKKRKKKYTPKAGQYSLEAGLKHFGERGETAVSKELKQFNVYDVFEPLYANELSQEEKLKALTSPSSSKRNELVTSKRGPVRTGVSKGTMW